MATYPQTIYVNATEEKEIKIGRGFTRRVYLFLQNLSGNDIYINQGTHADAQNGTTLSGGLFYERDRAVPQGTIWVRGSVAAPARQQIQLEEEFS